MKNKSKIGCEKNKYECVYCVEGYCMGNFSPLKCDGINIPKKCQSQQEIRKGKGRPEKLPLATSADTSKSYCKECGNIKFIEKSPKGTPKHWNLKEQIKYNDIFPNGLIHTKDVKEFIRRLKDVEMERLEADEIREVIDELSGFTGKLGFEK